MIEWTGRAASGEIDISEVRGEQPTISQSTLHYGAQWPQNQYSGSGPVDFGFDFSQDYHVFGAEWTNASIKFLVDDKEFHTENIDRNMSSGAPYTKNGQPFDQPFFWILNVAVGGQFFPSNEYGPAVTPDEARQWPKPTMEIDYVRKM
ncbi:unnamed protein product [Oppiella nova]|uniref:GH16 domain-containing protein n=1 Tax=Oppiella nova TaxID=334625 RepID=A0A7R9MBV2_9ACAR|nr:unnamed protein product [Oppiella nova]CAG2173424.1 unnamed protein product [Oppiella nova]